MVHVWFYIQGTSNSGATTITLPYYSVATPSTLHNYQLIQIKDNNVYRIGIAALPPNSRTITFYPTVAHGGWVGSGTKRVMGYLDYMAA